MTFENYESMRAGFLKPLVKHEKKALLGLLDPKRGEKILDAGCGPGLYSSGIMSICDVVAFDLSEPMVKKAKEKGINAFVWDIQKPLVGHGIFDKILCTGVLEFVEKPVDSILALSKVLKKNGIIVVLLPTKSILGLLYCFYHRIHGIRINLFDLTGLRKELKKHGLTSQKKKILSTSSIMVISKP
jgi:2-polyprenyl-3-methyl-5-hydroxy-6-metoxy-1,4-benzoquinol methylase